MNSLAVHAATLAAGAMLGSMAGKNKTVATKKRGRPPGSKNKPKAASKSGGLLRNVRLLRGATGMITQTAFTLSKPANKKVEAMELVVPTKVYTQNSPFPFSCQAGFQNAVSSASLDTVHLNQLNGLLPVNLTPYNAGTQRLVIKSHDTDFVMTNNTNATVELDIYDIVLRQDLSNTSRATVNAQFYNLSGSPENYWAQGTLASEGQATGVTPPPSQLLGVTPYDSQFFKDFFKVLQKKTIHMPLGAGHRHSVNLRPNQLITQTMLTNNAIAGWSGLTVFTMFVLRGFPLTDTVAGDVTTSSANLAIVTSQRTRYCFVSDTASSGYYADNLTTPAAANESLINAATGAIDQLRIA